MSYWSGVGSVPVPHAQGAGYSHFSRQGRPAGFFDAGGGGRGGLPWLASALGVTPLQRFPVEAEDVCGGSLGRSQALLELGGERGVSAGGPT